MRSYKDHCGKRNKDHCVILTGLKDSKIWHSVTPLLRTYEAYYRKKVQVGNDQEKVQSEKDSHSKNRGGKKKQTNNKVLRPCIHLISRMSSYFQIGGHSVTKT